MKKIIIIFIVIILITIIPLILAKKLTNKSYEIKTENIICIDGDTFKFEENYYRLSYVDTPEYGEEKYYSSSDTTCALLKFEEKIKIKENGKDKYGRFLVEVFIGGESLNSILVEYCLAKPFWTNTTLEIKKLYNLCK